MPPPDLSTIADFMVEAIEVTGDDIHLALSGKDDGTYSVALVSPMWGSEFAPLSDPIAGETCLAASGETPAAALAALAGMLAAFG